MRVGAWWLALGTALLGVLPAAAATPQEPVVVAIQVHGNHSIPDEEILGLAGLAVGDAATDEVLEGARRELEASGRFAAVAIDRRFRSLTAMDDVVVLIEVAEKVGLSRKLLFLPILTGSEEDGFVYGVRTSSRDLFGAGEFVSMPLTWGGVRRAALEVSRDFGNTRIEVFGQIRRWENPHFDTNDKRSGAGLRVRQRLTGALSARLDLDRHSVDFGPRSDTLTRYGAGLVLDTRPGMLFPWRGVLLSATWQRVDPGEGEAVGRWRLRGALHRRVLGEPVLTVSGVYEAADGPLPPYERTLVGGLGKLRGHEAGAFAGDRAAYGSVELRVPISSATSALQFGLKAFWDTGAAWNVPDRIGDVSFEHGVGGGLYVLSPLGALTIDLGFDLEGGSRLHAGAGVQF